MNKVLINALAATCGAVVAVWSYGALAQTDQPNIVLVLVDDMGYGDAGVQGQMKFTTPNIDRMAAEGMRFTDFYAAGAVCAPSRTSLMQGLHTGHGRVRDNDLTHLTAQDVTVAKVLKTAGYQTGMIGKWGIGESSPDDSPMTHGVDYFYGYINNFHAHNFFPEFLVKNGQKVSLGNVCASACGVLGSRNEGQGVVGAVRPDYAPFLFRDEAIAFIERSAKQPAPFFLIYSLNIPHINNEGGHDGHGQEVPDYGEFAAQNWPKVEQGYAQMMRYIDNDVGLILKLLGELGIDERTLVLFTSDNGPHKEGGHDPEFFNSNGELNGIKRDVTDGGIRVPMIAWWPGVIAPGTVSDFVGYSPDFMPTFAALAGITPPTPGDGVSLVPTLVGTQAQQVQHEFLYWELLGKEAVREGDWKLVGGALYNLANDIGEKNNVAAANPDVVARLSGYMQGANTAPVTVTWTPQRVPPAVKLPPGAAGAGGAGGDGGSGAAGEGASPPAPGNGGAQAGGEGAGEPLPGASGGGSGNATMGGSANAPSASDSSSGCRVHVNPPCSSTGGWLVFTLYGLVALRRRRRYG